MTICCIIIEEEPEEGVAHRATFLHTNHYTHGAKGFGDSPMDAVEALMESMAELDMHQAHINAIDNTED